MATFLKELVDRVTWEELYDTSCVRTMRPYLKPSFENLFRKIRTLSPEVSPMLLRVERIRWESGVEELCVHGTNGQIDADTGTEVRWGLVYVRWEEWLGMRVEPSALAEFGAASVVAACMCEMAPEGNSQHLNRKIWRRLAKRPTVFISHAHEDKDEVARPLARALERAGLEVWFDEDELVIGDSLRKQIATGILRAKCAVIVLSKSFFKKAWTERELAGIVSMETSRKCQIMPIWHDVTAKEVAAYDPSLADKLALSTHTLTIEAIAQRIEEAVSLRTTRRRSS
jgi:hypothetical protein